MKRDAQLAAMAAAAAAMPDPAMAAVLASEIVSMAANGLPPFPFFDTTNDVMTPEDVAVYLQIPKKKVIAEAKSGRIPARLIAGEWRFLRRAIINWFEKEPSSRDRPSAGIGKDYDEDPEEFIRRARAG